MSYVASVLAGLASTISWSARFAKNFSLLIWVGGNIANIEIGMMPVQLKVIWWFCQSTNMVPTLMSSDSGISGTPKSIILQTPNTKCSKTMTKRSLSAKMCLFVSSVRSSYSHPCLLLTQHQHHPLFQITPVLNTGLSLSEPLQLYKGYNAI